MKTQQESIALTMQIVQIQQKLIAMLDDRLFLLETKVYGPNPQVRELTQARQEIAQLRSAIADMLSAAVKTLQTPADSDRP